MIPPSVVGNISGTHKTMVGVRINVSTVTAEIQMLAPHVI
jgi:hypothetical protein